MKSVAIWNTGYINVNGPWKTVWASCPITVGLPFAEGSIPNERARIVIPINREPRITAIQVKVIAALRGSGFLNAGIPLEIASTPVIAEQPAANALRIRKMVSG